MQMTGLYFVSMDLLTQAMEKAPIANHLLPVDIKLSEVGGASSVRLIVLFTLLSVAPAILLTMTCFSRFLIVFSFLRQALGVQGAPPLQVMTGLSLFMTWMVMAPIGEQVYQKGIGPYLDKQIDEKQAFEQVIPPIQKFMLQSLHGQDKELRLFYDISRKPPPNQAEQVEMRILIPAFVTHELSTAFKMGFYILLPFLIIDVIVSAVLMSLGMAMLSPVLVSMPIKILVFVFVDGWDLVIGSLARSAML